MTGAALVPLARAAKAWLFDAALPLWAQAGFDSNSGLFAEKLDGEARSVAGPRRVRVQARQAYVFALAGRLGWSGPWAERVEAGLRTLAGPARAEGGAVGHLLDARGRLMDARRDLYDQAFALLACGAAASALRRKDPIARAADIGGFIDKAWRHPAGGYVEGEVQAMPRRQNPHMHLFEAFMEVAEADASPVWRSRAGAMAELFARRLFVPAPASVREFHTEDWKPAEGSAGRVAEPGHSFEWAWLLERWAGLGGADFSAEAQALYVRAATDGVCPRRGVAMDEVWIEGGVKTATARLWPQTEWLKAALLHFQRTGDPADAIAAHRALWLYLDKPREGLWADRMLEDGALAEEPAPASSFYHVALALAELIRVADLG